MFSFVRNYQTLPKWLYHFAFPPAMYESSCCSISSTAFGVVSVPDFGHSDWCTVAVLTCISKMTYDVEHLFISLFAICISSLMRCPLRSLAHFLMGLFVFLLLSFKGSLNILDNSPLSDMSFANIVSQPVAYLLILLKHQDFKSLPSGSNMLLSLRINRLKCQGA